MKSLNSFIKQIFYFSYKHLKQVKSITFIFKQVNKSKIRTIFYKGYKIPFTIWAFSKLEKIAIEQSH